LRRYTAVVTASSPERRRKLPGLQQAARHVDDGLVAPFDDPVLLRSVGSCVLMLDAVLDAVLGEGDRGEFTPVVSTQDSQASTRLHLDASLELLNSSQRITLVRQEREPHVAAVIIHKQQKKLLSSRRRRGDGPTDVTMYQIEEPSARRLA
jgi:hypothetical protein